MPVCNFYYTKGYVPNIIIHLFWSEQISLFMNKWYAIFDLSDWFSNICLSKPKAKSKTKKKATPSGAEVFGDRSQLAEEHTTHSIKFVVSNMLQGML